MQMIRKYPEPLKIINYTIGNDPNGGSLLLYGSLESKSIAIFCAGFPDDHEIGQSFCHRLSNETSTLVGVMCLPGYDDREDKPWTEHQKGGYSFDEMTNTIREAVKVLKAQSTCTEKAKIVGIFHDWAVVPGLMWANRTLEEENENAPDELVIFDVLGGVHEEQKEDAKCINYKRQTLFELFIILAYRGIFAFSFMVYTYISKYLAVFCNSAFGILSLLRLAPCYHIDFAVIQSRSKPLNTYRQIYMMYPYYKMFAAMFTGRIKEVAHHITLPKDLKKTPLLFLYGTEKRVQFHSEKVVLYLQAEAEGKRSKSNAIAVEDAGHWLYIQQEDVCVEAVKNFLEA